MKDVAEFLQILGYDVGRPTVFDGMVIQGGHFYRDEDYKFFTGIELFIYVKDNRISVETRTPIWRTKWDSDFHNFTVKQLRKRFGGKFHSDYGKGRYLKYNGHIHTPSESGCRHAYFKLHNEISTSKSYLNFLGGLSRDVDSSVETLYQLVPKSNPFVVSANLFLPSIVAVIEEYFKSIYIALLKYSTRKLSVLKNSKVNGDDLLSISTGELTVEGAIVKSMSFQNIGKVCFYVKELDNSLDIAGELRKPQKGRKENYFDALNRILNQRHELIHRNKFEADYDVNLARKDLETVEEALLYFYEHLIRHYGWNERDL
ncbi:hypothetical protein EON83_00020 [bacterium]|nr:MAG: hypothetical protein EON83_00020 [bacterium]